MKILFTGGSGFVGRNILPLLAENYEMVSPRRDELNLLDAEQVERYVKDGNFDIIIHSANTNPVKNDVDKKVSMTEGSLRCFMNLYRVRGYCKKLLYLGSGAEFAKTSDMHVITEEEFDREVPQDEYGFAKYIMNELARHSENVYNLRLFAVYGPTDWPTKFIRHCIDSIIDNVPITIRQDCYFDYMQVTDLFYIICWFIEHEPKYHDYNICSGEQHSLSEIAGVVKEAMCSNMPVKILSPGWNKEYTGSNQRLLNEIKPYEFISLQDGVKIQIKSQLG